MNNVWDFVKVGNKYFIEFSFTLNNTSSNKKMVRSMWGILKEKWETDRAVNGEKLWLVLEDHQAVPLTWVEKIVPCAS